MCGACAAIDFTNKFFLSNVSSKCEILPRNSLNQTPPRFDDEIDFQVIPSVEISPTTPQPDSISSFKPITAPALRVSGLIELRNSINFSIHALKSFSYLPSNQQNHLLAYYLHEQSQGL